MKAAGSRREPPGRPRPVSVAWAVAWLASLALTAESRAAPAEGWTTHRGDSGRTGQGSAGLRLPLHRVWIHQARPPSPAWGPPARRSYWQRLEHLEARVTDDHAYAPVMAGGAVYFGSSTEDQVRCLDAASGETRWVYRTDGPVRFAPALAGDRVVFGSDDGWLYAVGTADGRLVWRRRIGPSEDRLPGNGRLISPWPVRTGVLVEGGLVYATAGLYPQQGAWACALELESGTPRWQVPLTESPDGYLLATERLLIVPTGRASPIGLDRATGALVRRFDTGGGTFAVAADGELFGGPGNDATLTGVASQSGQRLVAVKGRSLVAAEGRLYLLDNGGLQAVDRVRQAALGRQAEALEARMRPLQERQRRAGTNGLPEADRAELGRLRDSLADVARGLEGCVLWRERCPESLALIGAGPMLVAGGSNSVAAFDRASGRRLWNAPVNGRALALAADQGRLLVATDRGAIEMFAGGEAPDHAGPPARTDPGGRETNPATIREGLERLVAAGLPTRGYALVAGLGSGRWIDELIHRTALHVVAVDSDPARVARIREERERAGDYGTRLAALVVGTNRLPFPDHVANVVLSESGIEDRRPPGWSDTELARVLRPFGGWRWTDPETLPFVAGPLAGAGEWTHQFGNPSNTADSGDRRVGADLVLQWFGGPGPDTMVDRHLRGPAPLSAGGRLVIPGENCLLAVDAYNGTELWRTELPGSQRYSMPYDAGYLSLDRDRLAVAVRGECWILDAAQGRVLRRFAVPGEPAANRAEAGPHWGYVVLSGGGLFGTAQRATASRTVPGYEQIDADYGNQQPLVTGHAAFRVDPESGATVWQRRGGVLLNATLTVHEGRMLFVEARAESLSRPATGRLPLAEILAGDPWLVALDAATGRLAWEQRLGGEIAGSRNILYLAGSGDRLVLLGSRVAEGDDTAYLVECRRASDGAVLWTGRHSAGQPGAFTHGEQVHHPVVLGDLLVAEPVVYDLASGRRLPGPGGPSGGDWRLVRPGHSCGTLSGAGDCLFFRANNPTVLDLRAHLRSGEAPRKLAPSRAGCWINMIPAGGLLLVPEASAGCVCQYSLQTSMAFRPR